jgi:hypothetical protein
MLIEQAPDRIVQGLQGALGAGRATGPMAEIQDMLSAETADRRVRDGVFGPLMALCREGEGSALLPPAAPRLLWLALKAEAPGRVAEARRATLAMRRYDAPPPIYDELCRCAAQGLRERGPAFAAAAAQFEPAALDRLVMALGLARIARPLLPRLPDWERSMDDEAEAAVRLAFKDATTVEETSAPLLMEIIYAHLEDPWHVLRVISALMDRPTDRYLAGSEMAGFGERLLQDLDERIDAVRRFDLDLGPQAAVELAASIQTATIIVSEFELWLDMAEDSRWAGRLAKARKALAVNVERRLKTAPAAVDAALPAYAARSIGKNARMMPRTTAGLDKDAVRRAYAILTFLSESRSSAAHGGFASMRVKIIEALDKQIDLYGDDLIDLLHEGGDQTDRLAAYLEVAADFLGLVRDPKAAEKLRRRAAGG